MFKRAFIASCVLTALLTTAPLADDADYSEKLSAGEKGLLAAINKERRAEGVSELKVNGKLMAAARIHARNMAAADRGSHELKDLREEWRTPGDRIKHVGYRGFAWGENIAWSYPRRTSHRRLDNVQGAQAKHAQQRLRGSRRRRFTRSVGGVLVCRLWPQLLAKQVGTDQSLSKLRRGLALSLAPRPVVVLATQQPMGCLGRWAVGQAAVSR